MGPFYQKGLTIIPVWIANHMRSEVCGEITYPFPKFKRGTVAVMERIINFMLGLKFIDGSKNNSTILIWALEWLNVTSRLFIFRSQIYISANTLSTILSQRILFPRR